MSKRQTSSEVIFFAMNSTARVARKARAILESQLDAMTQELASPTIAPKRRSEILLASAEILQLLDKSLAESGKLLIKPNPGSGHESKDPTTVSADQVFQEILHGRKVDGR